MLVQCVALALRDLVDVGSMTVLVLRGLVLAHGPRVPLDSLLQCLPLLGNLVGITRVIVADDLVQSLLLWLLLLSGGGNGRCSFLLDLLIVSPHSCSRLVLDLSLFEAWWRILPLDIPALVFLDLDNLLFDFVEAHQLVELVSDLIEHLQLVLEQASLLQMADEIDRWWNDVLPIGFILITNCGVELSWEASCLAAIILIPLVARSLTVTTAVNVSLKLLADHVHLLLLKLVFDLSASL